MAYVYNGNIRIHYQVEGKGFPVVLQHGFTADLETWYEFGYVDALKQNYQLILVDARGHGKSDKPHDSRAYQPKHFVSDIVAVLDDLGIDKAGFWGYSMGGSIGLAVAKHASERFSFFIIGGVDSYGREPGFYSSWIETVTNDPGFTAFYAK